MEYAVTAFAWAIPLALIVFGAILWGRSKPASLFVLALTIGFFPFYEYARPDVNVTTMASPATDIIRVDENGQNRDVRFIYTADTEYRNEDNRLWLKWDSGSMTNQAGQLSGQTVTVVDNGVRIPIFSMYPNAVAVNPGMVTWALIALHFFVLLIPFGIIAYVGRKIAGGKKNAQAA